MAANAKRKFSELYDPSGFYQRNEKLKAANSTEYVTTEEFERRITEIAKCKNDIKHFANTYFNIIGSGGKQVIPLYPRQAELLDFIVGNSRVVVKCPRQCGKTTANSIFALWTAMFDNDKRILVVANKMEVVLEIMGRIQFAYEECPFWLKPGVKTWNKGKIVFANGSTIVGTSTTSTSARSKSAEIILIDEFAWIPPKLLEPFFTSIMPIASSFKNSKVICVSTPNGIGNKFYELYSGAEMNVDNKVGWKKFDIDLDDVPGRDKEWRLARLAEFNGDMVKYAQEYDCVFHGSSYTLIKKELIKRFKDFVLNKSEKKWFDPVSVPLNADFSFDQWFKPERNHCYIVGADPGTGVGLDSSVILVFDVTDTSNIVQVASYHSNTVSTLEFPYIVVKLAMLYNDAYIAMESNNIGDGILNSICHVYEYENVINHNKNPGKLGIFSHLQVKSKACRWLRDMSTFDEVGITLYDKNIVAEMEWFERKMSNKHEIYQASGTKHDDFMMSFVWAMFCLHSDVVEDFFSVARYVKVKRIGLEIPAIVQSTSSSYFRDMDDEEEMSRRNDPDKVFNDQIFGGRTEAVPVADDDMPSELGFAGGETRGEDDWGGGNW